MSVIMASTLVFMACARIRIHSHETMAQTVQQHKLRTCIHFKAQAIILSLYTLRKLRVNIHTHACTYAPAYSMQHTYYACSARPQRYHLCERYASTPFHSYSLLARRARPVRNLREWLCAGRLANVAAYACASTCGAGRTGFEIAHYTGLFTTTTRTASEIACVRACGMRL